MKHLNLLFVFTALLSLFSSCNKDDDPEPATRANQLAAPRVWVFSGWTVNPGIQLQNGQIATDLYNLIPSTSRDNIIKFKRNPDTYTLEEGATKDAGSAQISDAGNWYLSSDEEAIILTSTSTGQYSYDIEELTATTFRYTYSQVDDDGNVYTFTETYTAQQ